MMTFMPKMMHRSIKFTAQIELSKTLDKKLNCIAIDRATKSVNR